jgi:hypothetical protein
MKIELCISQILDLQGQLLDNLMKNYPYIKRNERVINLPKSGDFIVNNESWNFIRHGAGIMFMRKAPLPALVVDMHDEIWNEKKIDPWRLQQFVESCGGTISHQEAKVFLETAGDMRTERDGY